MSQPVSDAAFELLGACIHSLRFAFGAPIGYPYAVAPLAEENPPPALFRRVLAASPPPRRDGTPWESGLVLGSEPFQPAFPPGDLSQVKPIEGAPSLDLPSPEAMVLDQLITIPRKQKKMVFPGTDRAGYVLSVGYWDPIPESEVETIVEVEYWEEFILPWDGAVTKDSWVAVSFDGFWPPERDSADLIIPIRDCNETCTH
jgi:hypothetical protein